MIAIMAIPKLIHKGSKYLYTIPTHPKIFEIKSDDECIDGYHTLKTDSILRDSVCSYH